MCLLCVKGVLLLVHHMIKCGIGVIIFNSSKGCSESEKKAVFIHNGIAIHF